MRESERERERDLGLQGCAVFRADDADRSLHGAWGETPRFPAPKPITPTDGCEMFLVTGVGFGTLKFEV